MSNQEEEMRLTWAEYRKTYALWQRARNDAVAKAVEEAKKSVRPLEVISDRAYANYNRAREGGVAEVIASEVPMNRGFRAMFRNVFRKTKNE